MLPRSAFIRAQFLHLCYCVEFQLAVYKMGFTQSKHYSSHISSQSEKQWATEAPFLEESSVDSTKIEKYE